MNYLEENLEELCKERFLKKINGKEKFIQKKEMKQNVNIEYSLTT